MANRIQVIERAADILNCFTPKCSELGVSEIARILQLDPTTVCRILLTMKSKGLVYCSPITHKYSIGPKILQLAQIGLGDAHLRGKALPHMRRLRDQTGETVTLSVRTGSERVFLEQLEGTHELRRTVQVGRIDPLYCGSAGKVLLAHMADAELDQYLASYELAQRTDTTITDPAVLRAELQRVHDQGFAVSVGEVHSWSAGVSAPVRDHTHQVLAALSIAMPRVRYTPDLLDTLVAALKDTARYISEELGCS